MLNLLSQSSISKLSQSIMSQIQLEAAAQAFLDALAAGGGPPIQTLSIKDARAVLDGAQSEKVAAPAADIEDKILPVGPSGSVSVRIVRPGGVHDILPAVIYTHGGGWVLGNKNTHDRLIREIANGTQAAVVFVNYTPSPEAQYPIPLEEAYAAAKWVAEHGHEVNIDGKRLAIAGDSVGGNMATAVTILAKERDGPKFLQQVLFYPVTDANFETSSYEQFQEGYFLTRGGMRWFWDQYCPEEADRAKPTASPLRATTAQLAGLPPALIITGEADVLRDEGEAYARKLLAAGVRVTSLRFIGIVHDFVMLNALRDTQSSKASIRIASEMLKKMLA